MTALSGAERSAGRGAVGEGGENETDSALSTAELGTNSRLRSAPLRSELGIGKAGTPDEGNAHPSPRTPRLTKGTEYTAEGWMIAARYNSPLPTERCPHLKK